MYINDIMYNDLCAEIPYNTLFTCQAAINFTFFITREASITFEFASIVYKICLQKLAKDSPGVVVKAVCLLRFSRVCPPFLYSVLK